MKSVVFCLTFWSSFGCVTTVWYFKKCPTWQKEARMWHLYSRMLSPAFSVTAMHDSSGSKFNFRMFAVTDHKYVQSYSQKPVSVMKGLS